MYYNNIKLNELNPWGISYNSTGFRGAVSSMQRISPVRQPRAGLEKNFGLHLSNGQVRFYLYLSKVQV